MRSSVDLPQPDGPTNTTNSPALTVEVDAVDDVHPAERLPHLRGFLNSCHACLPAPLCGSNRAISCPVGAIIAKSCKRYKTCYRPA